MEAEAFYWVVCFLFLIIMALAVMLYASRQDRETLTRRLKHYEPFDHDGDGRPGGSVKRS